MTKSGRFAVLGHPVAHSLSPTMQNAAFRAAGRNAVYEALDVPPPRLAESLAGLHAAGYAGLNITLPHKEEALRLAHTATPGAAAAGAANTLRWSPEGWDAEATDGPGLLARIAARGLAAAGLDVVVLGAGGAARGVASALALAGAARIRIVNRSAARAESVAHSVRRAMASGQASGNSRIEPVRWGAAIDGAPQLLVRALSISDVTPEERLVWDAMPGGATVIDLNYGERAAGARAEADRRGLRFEDGLPLLVEQGARSYEFWTGEAAPRAAMREAIGGTWDD